MLKNVDVGSVHEPVADMTTMTTAVSDKLEDHLYVLAMMMAMSRIMVIQGYLMVLIITPVAVLQLMVLWWYMLTRCNSFTLRMGV